MPLEGLFLQRFKPGELEVSMPVAHVCLFPLLWPFLRSRSYSFHSEHMVRHRQCPKEDCALEFKDEKEKRRHVWKIHRNWAERTGYPVIRGKCNVCGKEYEREDYVVRHKKEKHGGQKRQRKFDI